MLLVNQAPPAFVDVVGLPFKRRFGPASGVCGISAEEMQDSRNLAVVVRVELFIPDRQDLRTPSGEVVGPRNIPPMNFDTPNAVLRRRERHNLRQIFGARAINRQFQIFLVGADVVGSEVLFGPPGNSRRNEASGRRELPERGVEAMT
jgi:hypothetical protein